MSIPVSPYVRRRCYACLRTGKHVITCGLQCVILSRSVHCETYPALDSEVLVPCIGQLRSCLSTCHILLALCAAAFHAFHATATCTSGRRQWLAHSHVGLYQHCLVDNCAGAAVLHGWGHGELNHITPPAYILCRYMSCDRSLQCLDGNAGPHIPVSGFASTAMEYNRANGVNPEKSPSPGRSMQRPHTSGNMSSDGLSGGSSERPRGVQSWWACLPASLTRILCSAQWLRCGLKTNFTVDMHFWDGTLVFAGMGWRVTPA